VAPVPVTAPLPLVSEKAPVAPVRGKAPAAPVLVAVLAPVLREWHRIRR
jgi:hypothetical protein